MADHRIECALSGVTPSDDEIEDTLDLDAQENGLGFAPPSIPIGWTRISIQRRVENAAWMDLQEVKAATIQQFLMQIPDEARTPPVMDAVALQVEAQFAGLEGRKSFLPSVLLEATVYLASADRVEGLGDALADLAGNLNLPAGIFVDDTDDPDADDADDADDAPPSAVEGSVESVDPAGDAA